MNRYINYPFALLYGAYFYLAQQLIFLIRFKRFNTNVSELDIWLYVIGVLSVLLLFYFLEKVKKPAGKKKLFIFFIVAIPFATVGSLLGGLLGGVGIVLYGMIPFLILIPVGYKAARA